MFESRKEAWLYVGGLSEPSKMPCYGYSLPRSACKMGMLMAKANPNGICGKCYAKMGNYSRSNVLTAMNNRLLAIEKPQWVEAMAKLIHGDSYFRWHDSGDIQNMEHLNNIAEIARQTPNTLHWLPTREYQFVKEWIESKRQLARKRKKAFRQFIPQNLIIRLSASTFEGKAPEALARQLGANVSSVSKEGFTCPAPNQENKCGNCRACWDRSIFEITYKRHRSGKRK